MEKIIIIKPRKRFIIILSNIKMLDIVFGLPNETRARSHLYADG